MRLSLTGLVLPCSLLLLLQATLSLPHVRAAVARTSNSPLADDAHSPPLALAPNPQLTISILPSGAPSDELHSHPSPSLHAVGVPSGRERTPSTDADVDPASGRLIPPRDDGAIGQNHDPNAHASADTETEIETETSAGTKLSVLAVGVGGMALACHYLDYL